MNYLLDNMEFLIRVLGYILGFGFPVLVLAVMLLVGIPLKLLARSVVFYILLLAGPALVLLWYIYNGVLELWGFDSVIALLVNLFLFCALGVICAVLLKYMPRKHTSLRPYFAKYFQKVLASDMLTKPFDVEKATNGAKKSRNE